MAGNSSSAIRATAIGTAAQLAMVISGHYVPVIANLFAVLGMAISLAAGLTYARWAPMSRRTGAAAGGAVVGGLCAIIGIAVSYALGDVTALILLVGTASSAVTGAIGGMAGFVRTRA